jgi:hypothetical protein
VWFPDFAVIKKKQQSAQSAVPVRPTHAWVARPRLQGLGHYEKRGRIPLENRELIMEKYEKNMRKI